MLAKLRRSSLLVAIRWYTERPFHMSLNLRDTRADLAQSILDLGNLLEKVAQFFRRTSKIVVHGAYEIISDHSDLNGWTSSAGTPPPVIARLTPTLSGIQESKKRASTFCDSVAA